VGEKASNGVGVDVGVGRGRQGLAGVYRAGWQVFIAAGFRAGFEDRLSVTPCHEKLINKMNGST